MKLTYPFLCTLAISVITLLYSHAANGQQKQDIEISFTDSLQNEEEERLVSNIIFLINKGKDTANLEVVFTSPKGWNLIGTSSKKIKINPASQTVISANFIKDEFALSKWMPVTLQVTNKAQSTISSSSFYLKALPVIKFEVTGKEPDYYITNDMRTLNIEYSIKNTGNVEDTYEFTVGNAFLGISQNKRIKLDGGEEHTGVISVKVSELIKQRLTKETVRILVWGSKKKLSYNFTVNRLLNVTKQNPSPYSTFPVEVEAGVLRSLNTISAYAGFNGETKLKNGAVIKYGYRSKQFGIANRLERNIFRLGYATDKWKLYAGEMFDGSLFNTFGQGFSVNHIYKKKLELGFRAIFHNSAAPLRSDMAEAMVKHKIKNITLKHIAVFNTNRDERRGSFILLSEAELFKNNSSKLTVKAGVGQNHFMVKVPGTPLEKAGTIFSYDYFLSKGKINVASNIQIGTSYLPGVFSGSNIQNHDVSGNFGKYSVGAYYQRNEVITQNFIFRDSIFNTEFFELNMERYGVSVSRYFKKVITSFSAGRLKQIATFSTQLPVYNFVDFSINYKVSKTINFSFRSGTGFSPATSSKGERLWVSNSNAMLDTKYGGIRALFVRIPRTIRRINIPDSVLIQQTMSIAPYVKLNLFNKTLVGNIGYTIARSGLDANTVTFITSSLTYNNVKNGFNVRLNGNIPIQSPQANLFRNTNSNFVLTVFKKMSVPIPHKRKYYNLTLILFKDLNVNKIMDEGESPMTNAIVRIGDNSFLTNSKGEVQFRNVKNAFYAVDLTSVSAEKGFIPADGARQFPQVKDKNTTLYVAYQKGKLIEGKIDVILDSFSSKKYSAESLKVIVSDTSGNYYITLADKDGKFFINVPAGRYKVSLNPEVFSDKFQPDQMAYMVEVNDRSDIATVTFTIRQRNRQIIFLKSN